MKCRSCGSGELKLVLDLGSQPWGNDYQLVENFKNFNKYPLELYFCSSCSLSQINFTVPREVMFISHTYLSGTTRTLKKHFEQTSTAVIEQFGLNRNDLILDIGGNDGSYLEFFYELGYKTLNVDSGTHQALISKSKGIPTINDFFSASTASNILNKFGKAKIVHASGILFHLENLHDAFEGIKYVLDENGVLVAEFIYLPEMIKNLAYDQIYHEHLVYYTLFSFQNLLNKFNLEIFDCEFYPIHGGTCVAYISHKNIMEKTKKLESYYTRELAENFHTIEPLLEFAQEVKKSSEILKQVIKNFVDAGKKVYAIGAPVKGSTLVNYAGIDESLIPIAIEKNPLKFDTYFPGTRIKVVDEKSIVHPDVYLLLSWNFKDEIIPKFHDFLHSGGIIILPIPYPIEVTN